MRRYLSHDLGEERDLRFAHQAKTYLAIVDLESYPGFVAEKPDHLDLLGHLCRQMDSLNAVMWETPSTTLNLRLLFTDGPRLSNELARTQRIVFDGCVRTLNGQLLLTDDEQLLDVARRRDHDLLRGRTFASEARRPHLLSVPPGVINIGVFCGRPAPSDIPELVRSPIHYTILLRHYPHPAPRVAPVRLTGGLIPWAGDEAAAEPWGGGHSRFSDITP